MARKIKQYRFPYEKPNTNGEFYSIEEIFNGNVIKGITDVEQLGIQTLPGVKFKVNDSEPWVVIGHSGIFELDLNGAIDISKLEFSLGSLKLISENPHAYLIVDIVYNSEKGE